VKNGFIFITSEHTPNQCIKILKLKNDIHEAVFDLNELKNVEAQRAFCLHIGFIEMIKTLRLMVDHWFTLLLACMYGHCLLLDIL
jgi:hypothetical protein